MKKTMMSVCSIAALLGIILTLQVVRVKKKR